MIRHRRVLCIVLSAVLALTMAGVSAYATEGAGTDPVVDETTAVVESDGEAVEAPEAQDGVSLQEVEVAKDFTDLNVIGVPASFEYTGSIPELALTVEDGTTLLAEGTDYTVEYKNFIKYPEDGKAFIEIIGAGEYEGATKEIEVAITKPTVENVTNLKSLSGYGKVKLTWTASRGATGYAVYREENGSWNFRTIVTKPVWENIYNVDTYTTYKYKVAAVREVGSLKGKNRIEASGKTVKGESARNMRIWITLKVSKSLTSHDGKKKHANIPAGTRLTTDGYGSGAYYFNYKGGRYRVMNISAKNQKADLRGSKDYTRDEATYFINDYVKKNHLKSAKKFKYMLWASEYCQQMYVFKRVSGNTWKCINDWPICTGKPGSPSPTGNKKLQKHIRTRHGIPYWSCYQTMNSVHGVLNSSWAKKLGKPASHGCIRNPNKGAKWIYTKCKLGTRLIVY